MKLSICMPTYNRKDKAVRQMNNIISQILLVNGNEEIEFLVSDNHSSDETLEYVKQQIENLPSFTVIYRQDTNLGLVGNVDFLFNSAHGEYIWFISDDDIVTEGSVRKVYDIICTQPKDFYLLNFKTELDGVISDLYWKASDNYADLYVDGKTGGFGLISIEVFRKHPFEKLFCWGDNKGVSLMYPLSRTFYGLFHLNGMMVFDHAFVIHHVGDYSWSSLNMEVQSVYSLRALLMLKDLVPDSEFKFMLKLVTKTYIFRINSFLYVAKKWRARYVVELWWNNLLRLVLLAGLLAALKKGKKCLLR